MAVYRNVYLSFWSDPKVEDDFTPEDKFFYLYLLTNPQTNLCGCYEVSLSQMSKQTGYTKDTLLRLLERFEMMHEVIRFNKSTKEILILNWYKYNWSTSQATLKGVVKVASSIKCNEFKEYVLETVQQVASKSVSDFKMEAFEEYLTSENESIPNINIIKDVINYLNDKLGTRYNYQTKNTQRHINARIAEGAKFEDFKTVIDQKYNDWYSDKKMRTYLRPETLFGTKFESYLNQAIDTPSKVDNKKISSIIEDLFVEMRDYFPGGSNDEYAEKRFIEIIANTEPDKRIYKATRIKDMVIKYVKSCERGEYNLNVGFTDCIAYIGGRV